MKTATGLILIAIGAILAFAVTANTSVFNLHIAGFVIMLVGLAGLLIPRRGYASINRRLITRRSRTWPTGTITQTEETTVPPYVVRNPNSDASDLPTIPSIRPDPVVRTVMTPGDPGPADTEVIDRLRNE
jgi:hypothetical protein